MVSLLYRPDLEAELACDVLHQILMGTLPFGKALGNGQMKVRGAMLKSFCPGRYISPGTGNLPASRPRKGLIGLRFGQWEKKTSAGELRI